MEYLKIFIQYASAYYYISRWISGSIVNYVVAYLNKVNVQRNKFNLISIDVWH